MRRPFYGSSFITVSWLVHDGVFFKWFFHQDNQKSSSDTQLGCRLYQGNCPVSNHTFTHNSLGSCVCVQYARVKIPLRLRNLQEPRKV